LISDWDNYLERSKGNYMYLSNDANLIRNVGFPLLIAIINMTIFLAFKIGYYFVMGKHFHENSIITKMLKHKKYIYRTL
jgi:hypothetical protein